MKHRIFLLTTALLTACTELAKAEINADRTDNHEGESTPTSYAIPVSESHEAMAQDAFMPPWESLSQYETPEWFRDAKFGIWVHWGAQCVEGPNEAITEA